MNAKQLQTSLKSVYLLIDFWLQIIEAGRMQEGKAEFEAEFTSDLSHENVVQTFKTTSIPASVRTRLLPLNKSSAKYLSTEIGPYPAFQSSPSLQTDTDSSHHAINRFSGLECDIFLTILTYP